MATRRARPGRTLIIFFLGMAVLYGLVALAGSWKPSLGLDLQGGTRITLTAEGSPSEENLEEARRIIDERVNGRGIVEAEVTTQAGKYIVVEVPGNTENRQQLEETVRRQAQLRFRLVACSSAGDEAACTGGGGMPGLVPGAGRVAPGFSAEDPTGDPSSPAKGDKKSDKKSDKKGEKPSEPTTPTAPAGPADPWQKGAARTVDDELTWATQPDQRSILLYNAYSCGPDGTLTRPNKKNQQVPANMKDDPDTPLVACEVIEGKGEEPDTVAKYLMSPSVIEGTELDDASAGIPQNEVQWVVNIDLGNDKEKARPKGSTGAATDFNTISKQLVGTNRLFAIVLDGKVLSAPRMTAVISDGKSQITGDFNEQEATDLANSLKFGALPIAFQEKETSVDEIGPSLAGDQLSAGLLAGGLGLGLVMLYCLAYYRGLGGVVVALVVRRSRDHLRDGAAAERDRRVHTDAAGTRRLHHRRRHRRRLVHHLLRAHP